jgi:hypothetical protein
MANDDPQTADEEQTLSLVRQQRAEVDTAALITSLQDGRQGPERVRDALTLLAELDPDLIVQIALDALIQAHINDAAAASRA